MIKRLAPKSNLFALLFTLFLLVAPIGAYAQKISLNYENTPLKTVLNKISDLTDYKFVYTSDLEVDKITVSVKENNIDLKQILSKLFNSANINYTIKGKQVVLTHKIIKQNSDQTNSTTKTSNTSQNQKINVRGVVIDSSTGQILPGVSIQVKGKNIFQATNLNGEYSITVEPTDVLIFSFIGLEEQALPVENRTLINVSLSVNMIKLNDVVVTGYQTLLKERSTGSYSTITSESLDNKLQPSLRSMLEGQSAGVAVANNGDIVIRGLSTIDGIKTPLIVVDGYPLIGNGLSLESINADNIANITILKDAVAASIYGARASNGVIVITTKSAQTGKFSASYRGIYGATQKLNFSTLNRASISDYIDAEIDLFDADQNSYNNKYNAWSRLTEVQYLLLAKDKGWMPATEADAQITQLRNNNALEEISKHMLRAEQSQQHSLNITGGTEKNLFNGSLKISKSNGDLANNSDTRFIADVNNLWKPSKWFSFRFISNINYATSNTSAEGYSSFRIDPYTDLYTNSGEAIFFNPAGQRRIPEYDKQTLMKSMLYHPSTDISTMTKTIENLQVRVGGDVTLKINDDWNVTAGGSWVKGMNATRNVKLGESYAMRSAYNDGASRTSPIKRYIPDGGRLDESRGGIESWVLRAQINYKKSFNGTTHRINTMLGTEISKDTYEDITLPTYLGYNPNSATVNTGFDPYEFNKNTNNIRGDMLFQANPANLGTIGYGGRIAVRDNRFAGWYANGSYELMSKYIISGSARLDLTNFFGTDPKYRYKPTWSVGGTYKVSEEEFFKPLKGYIDRLNVRASYGINGNISLSYTPYLVIGVGQFNQNANGIANRIGGFPNNQLRWERTGITNLGTDIAALDNRLMVTFDYYVKKSTDLIANDDIDYTRGTNTLSQNIGSVRNNGTELTISGEIINKGNFRWNSSFIWSNNKNTLLHYNGNLTNILNYATDGGSLVTDYPMYGMWALKFAGLNDKGTPQYYNKEGVLTNGGGLQPEDAVYIGSMTPTDEISFINNFSYKNFDLSFMFISKLGGYFRTDLFNGSYINNRHVGERWRNPGDEKNTIYPKLVPGNTESFYIPYADAFAAKSNFLKLRELMISYNVPSKTTRVIGLSGAKVYVQGRNLFYLTAKNVDVDPEGINARPQVFFGISLTL